MNSHEISEPAKQRSGFIVVKLLNYKLSALTEEPDGTYEWADLGANTHIFNDREVAYNTGRTKQGLLCYADGVPTIGGITRYRTELMRFQTATDRDGSPA